MGRHSASVTTRNRRPLILTVAGALVLSFGVVYVVKSFGSETTPAALLADSNCDSPVSISLSTTPELKRRRPVRTREAGPGHRRPQLPSPQPLRPQAVFIDALQNR